MGKVTVFTLDGCSACKKAVALLSASTPDVREVSLTKSPEWKQQIFILTGGKQSVPQVFFGQQLIGGLDSLERLKKEGKLDEMIKRCIESGDSPLELKIPEASEYFEVIPKVVRDKWQDGLEQELGPNLSTPERPITAMIVIMDTPGSGMIVTCSAGEAKTPFPPGMSGPKGKDENEDKFYCQVTLDRRETLFIDGPSTFPPGLKQNYDHVQFGWSWYLGVPWKVRDIQGTVVALEKEAGILKPEHQPIVEAFRDKMVKQFYEHLQEDPPTEGCSGTTCAV